MEDSGAKTSDRGAEDLVGGLVAVEGEGGAFRTLFELGQ